MGNVHRSPREIFYGWGSIEKIQEVVCRRAFVVSDAGMRKAGHLDRVVSLLRSAGREVEAFDGTQPNPTFDDAHKLAEVIRGYRPDLLVGLGGGSSIDLAKAGWILYENPDWNYYDVLKATSLPHIREKAHLLAIPATSGAGSEVSAALVLSERVKRGKRFWDIIPDFAILDPEIPSTMPPSLTAHTGFDVLVHGIEAFVSTIPGEMADTFALEAMRRVFAYLPRAYSDGRDKEAREQMHYAATLAGFAMTACGLGMVHAIANQLTTTWGIPHGCANSILLPYSIRYNQKAALGRYAELARRLHIGGEDDEAFVKGLSQQIQGLRDQVQIPKTIQEWGVREEEFKRQAGIIAEDSLVDVTMGANPRRPTAEEVRRFLESAFYGEEVDCSACQRRA